MEEIYIRKQFNDEDMPTKLFGEILNNMLIDTLNMAFDKCPEYYIHIPFIKISEVKEYQFFCIEAHIILFVLEIKENYLIKKIIERRDRCNFIKYQDFIKLLKLEEDIHSLWIKYLNPSNLNLEESNIVNLTKTIKKLEE